MIDLSFYRQCWKTILRAIGWLLAVIVVHRRRAYFELMLALLEALFQFLQHRSYPCTRAESSF